MPLLDWGDEVEVEAKLALGAGTYLPAIAKVARSGKCNEAFAHGAWKRYSFIAYQGSADVLSAGV